MKKMVIILSRKNKVRRIIIDDTGKIINTRRREELNDLKKFPIDMDNEMTVGQIDVLQIIKYQLIEFMTIFYEKNKRVPIWADFDNSHIYPNPQIYALVFGSWNEGIINAGLEKKKYDAYQENNITYGQVRERQKTLAKIDGFDNIDKWLEWKRDPLNVLKKKYGEEFADWARKNKDKVPNKWISAGCKTDIEYRNRRARDEGFEDNAEKQRERVHERGIKIPIEFNEDCSSHIGCLIGEDRIGRPILGMIFEEVEKKKYANPGYEFVCKNPMKEFLDRYPQLEDKLGRGREYNIDIKTVHLSWAYWRAYWRYNINYNNATDYFMLIGLEEDDMPQFILFIHKNDMIRDRKLWERKCIYITKRHLSDDHEFDKHELIYELERLKESLTKDIEEKEPIHLLFNDDK